MPDSFYIYFYIALLVVVFLVTYIMDLIKIKKKKTNKIGEMQYLISKFKLDKNKINYKKSCMIISIINAFIIATVITVISMIKLHMTIQLAVGFILLFSLIYSMYEIYGRILAKKYYKKTGGKKNV